MSARKLKNSWWVDLRFNGERYRIRSPENSKAGAEAYEGLVRQKLARGEPINDVHKTKAMPTFNEFSTEWYSTYVLTNNKPSEQKSKSVTLRKHLNPFFGQLPVDQITNLTVEQYKTTKLKQGQWCAKTINNHLSILSKCLHDAEEWLGCKPPPSIKFLKVPPQAFDFLSPTESQTLLDAIIDPFWRDMVLVALKTGLRLGELAGLDWSDVEFGNQLLTVRRSIVRGKVGSPKSNKERHIPLTNEVCHALQPRRKKEGLIFSRTNGKTLHHESPRLAMHRFCKKAGLRMIGWHTLRHTFASHLAANGVSMRAIQELLGHSDIRTTMRYAHLGPSTLRQAINVLEGSENPETENFGQQVGNAPLRTLFFGQSLTATPVNFPRITTENQKSPPT